MPKTQVLAPAGSPEAVKAAVQSGADAIYIGAIGHNARQYAKNFDRQSLEETIKYCRVRGVKVYLALNTLLTDRELESLAGDVAFYAQIGVDAFIVQDLGLADYLGKAVAQIPLFASTQLSVHSLDGVFALQKLGFKRVIVARELTLADLKKTCAHAPMEVECFVHGALCMCHSGQCYMSAVIGGRSGNRGRCAQPCRLPYRRDSKKDGFPLSLKDLCYGSHLTELMQAGLSSFKIEGRMKRPEYVAAATKAYSDAVRQGRNLTQKEIDELSKVFSRDGFTDGYLARPLSKNMFGVRQSEADVEYKGLLSDLRGEYKGEKSRIPVEFELTVKARQATTLAASDRDGNGVVVKGSQPEPAHTAPAEEQKISDLLAKTGGTPYFLQTISVKMDEGLALPAAQINALRREALNKLTQLREQPPKISLMTVNEPLKKPGFTGTPSLTASFLRLSQLPGDLSGLTRIWLPITELSADGEAVQRLLGQGLEIGVTLPRAVRDSERNGFFSLLDRVREVGVKNALAGNIGLLEPVAKRGFNIHGDFGLNITNSWALRRLEDLGLSSATISFELTLPIIRDIQKPLPCEILAYGRLPLMVVEHCLLGGKNCYRCKKQGGLVDRKGEKFLLACEFGGRNVLLNSKPLYLADKLKDLQKLGLSSLRLCFTDEPPTRCSQVIRQYKETWEPPEGPFTRGLYHRGTQ